MSGRLFIVATPIGNLSDITERIKTALSECDFALTEDTRVSVKLFNHLGIHKRLVSCHEFNEAHRVRLLEEANAQGKSVCLLSDAGTPLVSDPGYMVVAAAIALGMEIIPLPGPSAFLLALVASGLPCDRFVFEGFLPESPSGMKQRLILLEREERTLIFYISPHKLLKTLKSVRENLGDRSACLAKEITKRFERYIRGTLSDIEKDISAAEIRGEYVLVVRGATEDGNARSMRLGEDELTTLLKGELDKGTSLKDASAHLAKQCGWSKSEIYKLGVDLKKVR